MRLGDFLKYESIVIQCHNNPDPDALASGFAVWKYLTRNGKKPVFVYGGREAVSKPNLLLMIRLFGIPVHHVKDQAEIIDLLQREREETDVLPAAGQKPDLLIMTDCQYGESNTQKFEAGMVAVIDHHEVADPAALPEMHLVMENYGSCATVVYGMLREEGYDFSSDGELQTALFYGLYTDTVRLQELWHPADKDMWDELDADDSSIKKLKNANIDEKDLVSIGNALLRRRISREHHYGFIETETGDPNILGIVSDTFLEVDSVNVLRRLRLSAGRREDFGAELPEGNPGGRTREGHRGRCRKRRGPRRQGGRVPAGKQAVPGEDGRPVGEEALF